MLNLIEARVLSDELRISKSSRDFAITMSLTSHILIETTIIDIYSKSETMFEFKRLLIKIL